MKLSLLVSFIDGLLKVNKIPDSSLNGLQVQGPAEVRKVAFAVDAARATIDEAVREGADLLIVHHGLFWREVRPAVGFHFERLKALVEGRAGLYAAHLPLDVHDELGNNALLLELFGLREVGRFARIDEYCLGRIGEPAVATTLESFIQKIDSVLEVEATCYDFGAKAVRAVGVISGKSRSYLLAEAAGAGCDTFVTGECEYESYHLAREMGVNLILAGHYATETVGVKALMRKLNEECALETFFIDHPTGL